MKLYWFNDVFFCFFKVVGDIFIVIMFIIFWCLNVEVKFIVKVWGKNWGFLLGGDGVINVVMYWMCINYCDIIKILLICKKFCNKVYFNWCGFYYGFIFGMMNFLES